MIDTGNRSRDYHHPWTTMRLISDGKWKPKPSWDRLTSNHQLA